MINCLSYALQFWDRNPHYKIWYNSDHCINIPESVDKPFPNREFLPLEEFGRTYLQAAFSDILTQEDFKLLTKYFNK